MIEALLKEILALLPARAKEVLVRRFGMKQARPETLEIIGASYEITRERVRQIEASALVESKNRAQQSESYKKFEKLTYAYLEQVGGARQEGKLLEELRFVTKDRHAAAAFRVKFLLGLSTRLRLEAETERRHAFWVNDRKFGARVIKLLNEVTRELKKRRAPLSITDAEEFLARAAVRAGMPHFPTGALVGFAQISKEISVNPYGEWGLIEWDAIIPSGVRDRAYYALKQCRKPLHFKDLAGLLNEHARLAVEFHPAWQKSATVQTVHNELIKDKRFVLVGRGLYALSEWGYKPGAVREVIAEVLKKAGRPLSKEEVLRSVKTMRLVKDATILINLQNAAIFECMQNGKYRLRSSGRTGDLVREA